MSYPVMTVSGERVMIVDKIIREGERPRDTNVLLAEDGRLFRPSGNSLYVTEVSESEAVEMEGEVADPDED